MTATSTMGLGEAVGQFLQSVSSQKAPEMQGGLQKFMRWYGREQPVADLTPRKMETFSETVSAENLTQLAPVRDFLKYAHKEGLLAINLAPHVKARRVPARTQKRMRQVTQLSQTTQFTTDGFEKATSELEGLKRERVDVAEEIRRAAADKDFRENAPLDAAREKQGHLEARIRDLEQRLRFAQVAEAGAQASDGSPRVRLGSQVVVHDVMHNEQITYTLVGPTEVNPAQYKISIESPAGRSFLHRKAGETVSVKAPMGMMQDRIESIG
ncbi:MAG: transcription elongation factor GreA [Chloroflexi bacterium]|nr:transcription elongation factor GreA [Chloroflexota bacterium]